MSSATGIIAFLLAWALIPAPVLGGTFSVKDFGAAADGVTDDTAAFQKALQRAAEQKGNTVFAPAGRYLIAGSLQIPAATTLQGEYRGPGRQRGTVLLSTYGKGRTDGPGCIMATAGGSAVKGISRLRDLTEEVAPLRRNITQEDVGDVAVFLASDLARAVTGNIIFVDSGFHIMGEIGRAHV